MTERDFEVLAMSHTAAENRQMPWKPVQGGPQESHGQGAATAPSANHRRRGLVLVAVGLGMLLGLLAAGMVLIPRYRAAHPISELQRSDADAVAVDDIYLDVTLATPSFLKSRKLERYLGDRDPASVLPVVIGVNAHTGDIQHLHHLGGQLVLIGPDGSRYPSITEPIVISQHHNAYLGQFPARDNRGRFFLEGKEGAFAIEIAGVGKQALRRFEWSLPVPADFRTSAESRGIIATAMLAVAIIGALLVVLSPCALELTLYYTAIIGCTVAEGEKEATALDGRAITRAGRRRILLNLTSFVIGFTLLYAASGATVGLIGQGVRQPLSDYGPFIQTLGGLLIIFFAVRVLGLDRLATRGLSPLAARFHRTASRLRSPLADPAPMNLTAGRDPKRVLWRLSALLARWRFRGVSRCRRPGGVRARDSFLAGMGLSSSCLTCMGGAVLYPLLVYAGITSWYWGLVTLSLFSLGIAVPMVLISLGFFRIRLSLGKRLGVNRLLRLASGTLLAGIGVLILSGRERVVTDLAFGFLGAVSRWLA